MGGQARAAVVAGLALLAAGCGGARDADLAAADRVAAQVPVYPGAELVERDEVEYEPPEEALPWDDSAYDRLLVYRLRSRADEAKVIALVGSGLGPGWDALPIERGIGVGCWSRGDASVSVMTGDASPRESPSYAVVVGTSGLGLC